MNRQSVMLFGLIAFATLMATEANAQQGGADELQGTWTITSFVLDGKTIPAQAGKTTYTFDRGKVVFNEKGRPAAEGTYKVDVKKTPKQLDLFDPKSKDVKVSEAIYEITGDTLKLVSSSQGPKGKRPTSLDAKETVVVYFTRVKASAVIAEARFNNAPDTGWATAWGPASPGAVIKKIEGGSALHLSNAGATRRFTEPQKGRFVVEQNVQVPKGGGVIAYVRDGEADRKDGPVWRVADGKFFVLLQDGKWADTSFAAEAGKWHKVVIAIDVSARTWEFSVDGSTFKSAKPLPFRAAVDQLDTVRYLCENAPGIYIGAVRILRSGETAAGDPYAGWQTVEGNHEGLRFSLRIPPGWKWKEVLKNRSHHAVKEQSFACTIFVGIDCMKLDASEKKFTSEAAAKNELKRFLDNRMETKAVTFVAKEIIKVGGVDAAWFAFRVQSAGQPAPQGLTAECVLQTAGYKVEIHGDHADLREKRSARDFDESLAEFRKIAESFRVVGGKTGK